MSTTQPDLPAARTAAIEASGWGRPFRLFQPHNLAFWVWMVCVALGVWHFVHVVQNYLPLGETGLVVGALVISGYAIGLYIFFRLVVDRYNRLPLTMVAVAILWGGFAATYFMAIRANDANIELLQKLAGQGFANDWAAAISAPIVEESSKAAGLLLLITLAPLVVRSLRSALVIGTFLGFGFQLLEDLLYGAQGAAAGFYADQAESVLGVAGLRLATGVISHPAYTALCCVGLMYVIGSPVVRRNVPRGVAFILAGLLVHGMWDGAHAIGDGGFVTFLAMVGSLALAIAGLVTAFRLTAVDDRETMRAILAPEVASGVLSQEEADAAGGTRKERKRFTKEGKHREHRRRKHVLEATLDLSHELALTGGADSPQVEHARQEVTRLRADDHLLGDRA